MDKATRSNVSVAKSRPATDARHQRRALQARNRKLTSLVNRCLRVGAQERQATVTDNIERGAVRLHALKQITEAERKAAFAAAQEIREKAGTS